MASRKTRVILSYTLASGLFAGRGNLLTILQNLAQDQGKSAKEENHGEVRDFLRQIQEAVVKDGATEDAHGDAHGQQAQFHGVESTTVGIAEQGGISALFDHRHALPVTGGDKDVDDAKHAGEEGEGDDDFWVHNLFR